MKRTFGGKVLFLNRADINTDEIIPARYLTEIDKEALGPHLLEDLNLEGFDASSDTMKHAQVVITRENFGCGSSREHAVWAFEVNGYNAVIAPSYARIFRKNMFNSGLLAIELTDDQIDGLFKFAGLHDVTMDIDLAEQVLVMHAGDVVTTYAFELSPFDKAVVDAGGWVEYADSNY